MGSRRILVTGVSRELGSRVARALAAPRDGHGDASAPEVIGVDLVPPRHDLGAARFVRADIRNPALGRILAEHDIDTIVHLAMVTSATSSGTRAAMKEMNVIGTMQLLAAGQRAPLLRTLVVQSSISVYGASFRDPARFTEEMTARVAPRSAFARDSLEMESYVRAAARRRPDLTVATLRLANLMGAGVDSTMTRLLSLPVVPTPFGFDARLQFLHPDDAVAALTAVAYAPQPGTFNVGAPDVVTLHQAIGLVGRQRLPVPPPFGRTVAGLLRRTQRIDLAAEQLDVLTYGRAMDVSRFERAYGLRPRWTSRRAVEDFAASLPGGADHG